MDFQTKSDIQQSFSRIDNLFECGIFNQENSDNPLVQSALTELLIRLRDLMAKSNYYANGITFEDDINQSDKITHVSDTIKFIRDAMCHIDSNNHNHDECNARLSYNRLLAKLIYQHSLFKTSKTSFLIPPLYDTSGNSFTPSISKLLIA